MFYQWIHDLYDYHTDYIIATSHNTDLKLLLRERKRRIYGTRNVV